jgi:hypothetical protein
MRPISLWSIIEGFAAVASIISLVALLVGISDAWKVVISLLLIASAVIVFVASLKLRQPTAQITKRTEMMEKGEAIIRGTMRTLVMFGGDMSWASNYAPAIRAVTNMGKTVVVIYPESQAPQVLENAALLAANGANLNPIGDDTRLRGFLVDPDNRTDARFWLATRRLKKEGESSEAGVPGGLGGYDYVTREFRADQDPELIDALLTVYRVVCP